MRGHVGVRIALCEKLLGRPSWDAALVAWTAGETRVGRGTEGDGDGEWSTNGLVPPPSLRHRDKPSDEQTPRL